MTNNENIYTCPMHPEIQKSLPGVCPKCGMQLILQKNYQQRKQYERISPTGMTAVGIEHSSHHKMMIADFRRRFYISLILTAPILLFSRSFQSLLYFRIEFIGMDYFTLILSTGVYFYGGWPFLKGLFSEIRSRSMGMMTLIALAISVAYIYSVSVIFGLRGEVFFWELATLIDIMLLGHWLEMRSILGASRALEQLVELMPTEAHRVVNSNVEDVPLNALKKGDVVRIKPGEKVPSDGIIIAGSSHVNESMLTGESVPIKKVEGNRIIGGSINGEGAIDVKVQNTGEESYLKKVINLVRDAQASKSRTQRLADRAANALTIISISVGIITLITWLILGSDIQFAIERMATVMVITCPHALGLAVPLVVAISTALSAAHGLLIRNRTAFEESRRITTVVFDKTGTLTEGIFGVINITSFDARYDNTKILQLAGSLEQSSEHPIARGIIAEMKAHKIEFLPVTDFQAIKGKGIEGSINHQFIKIMSPGSLREAGIVIPSLKEDYQGTTVFILIDNFDLVGAITLSDRIRKESYLAVKLLQNGGIKCKMLTGDNAKVADSVSKALGLDGYFAEVLPHEKLEKIKELQAAGETVAMTGDGINDAPALAQADVGIAIGAGTDIAVETADIILVNSNPMDVAALILFGKATYKKMIQNLIWATGYNVVAIPLAAGVLASYGIILPPAIAAILMSISTIIVAINAKLLKIKERSAP